MYRSRPLRSTLNTNVITGLGIASICAFTKKSHEHERFHAPPRIPEPPLMYETARPVYKMDINTSFTLRSTCEKMRTDEGSEGTTTINLTLQKIPHETPMFEFDPSNLQPWRSFPHFLVIFRYSAENYKLPSCSFFWFPLLKKNMVGTFSSIVQ